MEHLGKNSKNLQITQLLNFKLFSTFSFRCKPKECDQGSVFNYNTGECDPIQCLPGYELDSSNKCVGKYYKHFCLIVIWKKKVSI